MRSIPAFKLAVFFGLAALVACSASSNDKLFGGGGQGGSGGNEDASTNNGGSDYGGSTGMGGGMNLDVNVNNEGAPPGCSYLPTDTVDHDGDGFSNADGDCNDCDPNTNPGAFDDGSPSVDGGPPVDSNCDGQPGGDTYECDTGIDLADSDAMNGAKAIGLCKTTKEDATGKDKSWGVISAKYVKADGTDGMAALSHGILPNFGQNGHVQQGAVMLGLSSGTARGPAMAGYQDVGGADMGTSCAKPIPNMDSNSCPGVATGEPYDAAALEVRVRVPTNAKSFKFYLNFYTYEFPDYICSQFNDFFVTLMDPKPQGSSDGNISFDQDTNPISVNNSMLQVCEKQNAGGKQFLCPLGTDLLAGTGFDTGFSAPHAATGWLQTVAPVTPGSIITLRWAIWDSGDHVLDSSVLVDNFTFSVEPAQGASTEPVPVPK